MKLIYNTFFTAFFALSLMLTSNAHANAMEIQDIVITSSNRVIETINLKRDNFNSNPEELSKELLTVLEPITDFDNIAKGVMGKHYAAANEEQHTKFTKVFKMNLIELYGKALLALKIKDISILETRLGNASNRAKINVEVVTQNQGTHNIRYTMQKDDTDKWKINNITVAGVNLGLTYRNQFYSAMTEYGNDLDKVIANWRKFVG